MTGSLTDSATTPVSPAKSGTGILRLDAANTFTGTLNATAGTLLVNGSVSPSIIVSANATLGGRGTIGNATLAGGTAETPAILSPGDASIDALASTGTLTLGSHSRLRWEVGLLTPSVGDFDRITAADIAITATSGAPFVIEIIPTVPESGPAAGVFPIATSSGSLTGFSAAAVVLDTSGFPPSLGSWEVRQTGNILELVYSPGGYNAWIAGYPNISDPGESADPDGDGWANREEWIAGTDPTDSTSVFTTTVTPAGGLSFSRIPGRAYIVETTIDLTGWSLHTTVPAGSGEIVVDAPDPPGTVRFYRVRIELGQ